MRLTCGSLFSGIGGLDLAAEWAGMEIAWQCEIDPFCRKVLQKHWPEVTQYDNITKLDGTKIQPVDIIFGGYPCQPYSHAGKRGGAEDDRALWPQMFRLIQEIRPTWAIGENVAGHVTLGLDETLSDLESIGYSCQPFVIPAVAVDAPHRRDRVFIVAYSKGERFDARRTESKGFERELRFTRGGSSSLANAKGKRRDETREHQSGREEERSSFGGIASNASIKRCDQMEQHDGRRTEREGPICQDRKCSIEYGRGESWWSVEPSVGRVAHGIPGRVDRLKSLGNAVVPQQAYPIFQAISNIEKGLIDYGDQK